MRLVSYDREGARRLGALVGDRLVDLPDAVGHPAFPTTMEALVARHQGTVMDAAMEALSHPDNVEECTVPEGRLLVPVLPPALRAATAHAPNNGLPRVLGPDADLAWPRAGELRCGVELACVIGVEARDLPPARATSAIFGYTLASDWSAPADRGGGPEYLAIALGPCLVTADQFEPFGARVVVRVDGEVWATFRLGSVRWTFVEVLTQLSRDQGLAPGELYGSGAVEIGDRTRRLRPGSLVEVEAEGIGVLRTRIRPARATP